MDELNKEVSKMEKDYYSKEYYKVACPMLAWRVS